MLDDSVTKMLHYLNWDSLRYPNDDLILGLFERFNLPGNFNFISAIVKQNSN